MQDNSEQLKRIVGEYEALVPSINEQLQFYKKEYEALKKEILYLEEDNKILTLKLEESLSKPTTTTLIDSIFSNNDLIDNLKSQLNFSTKEKASVTQLWRASLRRIDYLESEIKFLAAASHSNSKPFINKLKKTYERQLGFLQVELKKSHSKLEIVTSKSKTSLKDKEDELEKANRKIEELNESYKKLETEFNILQKKKADTQSKNIELETTISNKNQIISDLKLENYNSKLKVAEACHVVEAALLEKDAALLREKDSRDEVNKLRKTLTELLEEAEIKIKNEISNVKEEYNAKLCRFKLELKKSESKLEFQNYDLEKRNQLCKELELEIDKIKSENTKFKQLDPSEKQYLNMKIEKAYQNLLSAERINMEIKSENEKLKNEINELNLQNEILINSKEIEKQVHETKIKALQSELEINSSKLMNVVSTVDELNKKIKSMNMNFEQQSVESQKLLKEKIDEIQEVNKKLNSDLHTQLQSQMELNRKWKHEAKLLTEKSETRISELKEEIRELKLKLSRVQDRLEKSQQKTSEYKEHLQTMCQEFSNIANSFVC